MLRVGLQIAQAAAGAAVLGRFARGRRRRPGLRAGASPSPAESVSVVIPARDEEARLGPCLAALREDPDVLEVVVVDDRSTDETAAVARSMGAQVVDGANLAAGWRGKAWALQQGLEAARGDRVLFLDADTRPVPGLARELLALARAESIDLLSAGPRFRLDDPLARALHASMTASIPYRFGPLDVPGWQPAARRAILNGQCVLAEREALLAAGGWGRVRGNMTEDSALARSLRGAGWRLGFAGAAQMLEVHPYGSLGETWEGWGRSLMSPDVTPLVDNALDLALLWLALGVPLPRVLARRATLLDWALLALRLVLLRQLAAGHEPRGAPFWLSPLLDVATCVRLTIAVARPSRTWRGRTYATGHEAA